MRGEIADELQPGTTDDDSNDFLEFSSVVDELKREAGVSLVNADEILTLIPVRRSIDPVNQSIDPENLRKLAVENAHYISREEAEKYKAIILNAPFGMYKFRVGVVQSLSPDEQRLLSRRLLGYYSTSVINFQLLDELLFETLLQTAYAPENVPKTSPSHLLLRRQQEQQTRETIEWGGNKANGTANGANQSGTRAAGAASAAVGGGDANNGDGDDAVKIEELAGTRIDISNLAVYYELKAKLKNGTVSQNSINTFTFVKYLLQDFILSGASDLHVHSWRGGGRIRYRFQGRVYTRFNGIPAQRFQQIVNCLCTLAAKDPSKMKQIGVASVIKLTITVDGEVKPVEFRFQSNPTLHYPSIILRGQAKPLRDITKCGFTPEQLNDILEAISKDRGIVVVTGPTGSGKTNTLNCIFALLEEKDDLVVIEIGSPIEIESPYRIQITMFETASEAQNDIIRQKTFADAMRSDPDVIGYTEIRTHDESRIAFRAAVTGHRVLTTLHAADVEETFGRLFEMGIDRSIIAKGILAIVAQTLVRKLCVHCRQVDIEGTQMAGGTLIYNRQGAIDLAATERAGIVQFTENQAGCSECDGGFAGRTVIAEVLTFNEDVQKMINQGYKPDEIAHSSVERGYMIPMKKIALGKLNDGITSQSEVINLLELKTSEADIPNVESPMKEESYIDALPVVEAEYEDVKN